MLAYCDETSHLEVKPNLKAWATFEVHKRLSRRMSKKINYVLFEELQF